MGLFSSKRADQIKPGDQVVVGGKRVTVTKADEPWPLPAGLRRVELSDGTSGVVSVTDTFRT
jgi:hypothetical protein